jgi:hypothetical protein
VSIVASEASRWQRSLDVRTNGCDHLGQQCVYKEKGQPGLRPGYGRAVEERLTEIEQRLDRLDQTNVATSLAPAGAVNQAPPLPGIQAQGQSLQLDRLDQTNGAPSLAPANAVDQAPRLPGIQAQHQSLQLNTAWSGQQQRSNANNMDVIGLSTPVVGSMPYPSTADVINDQAMTADSGLPSAEVLMNLVELFFAHVYPWAPLFEKLTFMTNMWQEERRPLLHGIVVCSTRFWEMLTPSREVMQGYLQHSRDRLVLHCLDSCSLITTQALTLLAIDALSQGPSTRIWMIRSMLNAASQQLGLGKEQSSRTPEVNTPMVGNEGLDNAPETSNIAIEERRRLFWTMFSIDHFASVALGQSSGIPTRTIKLHYPCSETQWYQPSPAEWFQPGTPVRGVPSTYAWSHYIDILTLLDRSNRLLVHPCDLSHPAKRQEWQSHFRMMSVTLTTWLETCADECRNPNQHEFDPMWTIVRATYEL